MCIYLFIEDDRICIMNTDSSTVLTIKNCTRKDDGEYFLYLKNCGGEHTCKIIVVIQDTPGPSKGPIEFKNITADSITILWEPPENNGGSEITSYLVDYREFGRSTWSVATTCTTKNRFKVSFN